MSRLAGPALLSLIVILFNWKLVLTNQYTWLEGSDIVTQVLPWFQFQASEWHKWRIPLWDPTSWYGQPLFGEALPASAYPLNWLLFWTPLKNGWLRQSYLHWYYVVVRILAALSAYALCRELGRSRIASIIGGCIYGLGGYVGNTDWPQTVNGAITSPLVFVFLLRAEKTRAVRYALLSGFFMGFGWLAGHHQMNLLVSLAAAGLWGWLALYKGLDTRIVKLAACAMVVAVLASGLQTLPTAEYGQQAVRWIGLDDPIGFNEKVPYSVHQEYSLKPLGLLATFLPSLGLHSNPFVGIVALALGILGTILCWKEPPVRWLVVIASCAMLYALGFFSVFHGVLYALVPLIEKARVPAAGTIVFAVAIAPLAAFGVDALPLPDSSAWSQRAGRVLLAIASLATVATTAFFLAKVNIEIGDHRLMITAAAAAGAAAILAAWRSGSIPVRSGSVALLVLILLEIGNVTNYQLPNRAVPEQRWRLHVLSQNSDLAAFIKNRAEQGRTEYDGDAISYNLGAWYGLETFQAPGASVLDKLWRMDLFSPRSRDFFGIRYWIGKKPNRDNQPEVFRGAGGLNIYENLAAFPRAFSVHRVLVESDIKQLRSKYADPTIDLRRTALLQVPVTPALQDCPVESDEVDMPLHAPNFVLVKATLACRGLVVLTDSWFPGWRASVDGRDADIIAVNSVVRGVAVDAGQHQIEMRYRPWSVGLGALMSFSSLLLVVLASWRKW